MWIDIGVNLTAERLLKRLPQILENAKQQHLSALIVTGTSVAKSHDAQRLCLQHDNTDLELYFTAGIHPHDASGASEQSWAQLRELLSNPKAVAVGECGLDFNRNFSSQSDQLKAFEAQLSLAAEVQKPVFLHERDAFSQQQALLQQYRPDLIGGVAHCFTGDRAQLEAYLDLDLHIGITGWLCDLKRGQALRDAVTALPLDKVLLETDAPYLLPKTLKTKQGYSEPAHLPHIAEQLARLMQVDVDELRAAALANSQRLFGLPGA